MPPAKPPPEPLPRHEWTLSWSIEARRLRPEIGLKFATLCAAGEWVGHQREDPVEAARAWCAKPRKAP